VSSVLAGFSCIVPQHYYDMQDYPSVLSAPLRVNVFTHKQYQSPLALAQPVCYLDPRGKLLLASLDRWWSGLCHFIASGKPA
jgi:hypothetical protein